MEIAKKKGGFLAFDAKAHKYFWNDVRVKKTVTQICKAYPLDFSIAANWAAKEMRDRLEIDLASHAAHLFPAESNAESVEKLNAWLKDASKSHVRARDEAGDFGTVMHNYIEMYLSGTDAPLPSEPKLARACESLGKWVSENVEKPILIEHRIYDEKHSYAGTLDLFAEMRSGETAVVDWKTVKTLTKAPKSQYVGQSAAYAKALEAEGHKVDSLVIVEVQRSDAEIVATRFYEIDEHYEMFLCAMKIQNYVPIGTRI
jgi:hypothetical protein